MPKRPDKPKKKPRRTSVVVGHTILIGKDGKPLVDKRGNVRKKPIIKYPTGPHLADKVKELKRIHGAGGPGALYDVLFGDYAEKWLGGQEGLVDENTLSNYRAQVRNYLVPYLGERQIQAILQSDIKLAFAKLTRLSVNVRRNILVRAKSIFWQAVDDGIRPDNPARSIRMPMDREQKRRALTEKEEKTVEKFLATRSGTQESMALAIFFYAGVRKGECYGLQWKHLDFKNRKVLIRQQLKPKKGTGGVISPKLKTKRSYRDIPMQQQLYDALYPYRGLPDIYVFQKNGNYITMNGAYRIWLSIKEYSLDFRDISYHYFRYNYATQMMIAGIHEAEAATYFGDTVAVMEQVYGDIKKYLLANPKSKAYDIFPIVAKSLHIGESETRTD
jgi:integrase